MGRRSAKRVLPRLRPKEIDVLPEDEIRVILRGADDLIMRGGRTLLAKLLKGSRDRKVLALELDRSPAYGALCHLALDDITGRIDWLIEHGYLALEYDGRLPLLVFTPRGWAIEREVYAGEILDLVDSWADGREADFDRLNETHRDVLAIVLERIGATGDPRYLPLLRAWSGRASRRQAARIKAVIRQLSGKAGPKEEA